MTQDSTQLRERQEEIRHSMHGQSEGEIEAAIRRACGGAGPMKLRTGEKRPLARPYPVFLEIKRKGLQSD